MAGSGEISRLFAAVLLLAGRAVERDEVAGNRGRNLFDVPAVRVAGSGKISRLFAAVLLLAGRAVERDEVAGNRGRNLFDVPAVRVAGGGEISRLFAAVLLLAGRAVERDEVAIRRGCDLFRFSVVQGCNVVLHCFLICRREISADNVARRPRPRGRAVLPAYNGQHVPVLCGHQHSFRRRPVCTDCQQVRRIRQHCPVNDVYGRSRRRQRAGQGRFRRVRLWRVHFCKFCHCVTSRFSNRRRRANCRTSA